MWNNRKPTNDGPVQITKTTMPVSQEPTRQRTNWSAPGADFDLDNQSESQLHYFMGVVMRRKWLILAILAVVLLLSGLYAFLTTPIYRSRALLEIEKDTSSSLGSLSDSAAQPMNNASDNEMFETQKGILKSRRLAEAVIDKLNLEEHPEFSRKEKPDEVLAEAIKSALKWATGWETLSDPPDKAEIRDNLLNKVMDRISVKREGKSRLMSVVVEAESAAFSKQLLESYIDLYLADNLSKRRRVSTETASWLREELRKAEEKSLKASSDVVAFTRSHALVGMETENNHLLTFFNKAAEGLVRAKETRAQLEALKLSGGKVLTLFPRDKTQIPDLDGLHNRLGNLESEYAKMGAVYPEDYPKMVLLRREIDFIKGKIAQVQKDVSVYAAETAKAAEKSEEEGFEQAKQAALEGSSFTVQYAVLKKTAETTQEIFNLLLRKSKEVEVSTHIIGNNVITVESPSLPVRPAKPLKKIVLLVGCLVGIIGGISAAFLIESLDRGIRNVGEIEHLNLRNLGTIPHAKSICAEYQNMEMKDVLRREFSPIWTPNSPIFEALVNVRTSLFLSFPSGQFASLLVTSALPGEGKTFSAVLLGSVMCSSGARVVIVDADLRKSNVHKVFKQKIHPGLSTLLTDDRLMLKKTIHKSPIPGLSYICAGSEFTHPIRLFGSERFQKIISELKGLFDFVIVDSPPVIGLSDSRVLTTMVDGVVLVIKQGHSTPDMIRKAVAALSSSENCVMLGTIFNGVSPISPYFTRYSDYYG